MRQKEGKIRKKRVFISWFLLGLFISLIVLFTVEEATSGAYFAEIERTKNSLIDENKLLESEIIRLSSLKNLEENAEDLGFVKPLSILYITDGYDVAKAK